MLRFARNPNKKNYYINKVRAVCSQSRLHLSILLHATFYARFAVVKIANRHGRHNRIRMDLFAGIYGFVWFYFIRANEIYNRYYFDPLRKKKQNTLRRTRVSTSSFWKRKTVLYYRCNSAIADQTLSLQILFSSIFSKPKVQ